MRPERVVGHGFFVQRHADAEHHAADDLAAGGLGIDDPAGGDGVTTRVTRTTPSSSSTRTSTKTAEWVYCEKFFICLGVRFGGLFLLDAVQPGGFHDLGDGDPARGVG